jgi:Lysozyme like domain
MDYGAAGVPEYERQHRLYRERVAARYRALRLAGQDRERRARLRALRRLHDTGELHRPRPNRRPAIVLAVVFLVLIAALVFVARASGGPAENRRIICQVFTGWRCGPALRVARCETGGTFYARALGRAGERGLFQIHPVHFRTFDRRRLFEPRYNARAAFRLSRGGRDWSPWTCRP